MEFVSYKHTAFQFTSLPQDFLWIIVMFLSAVWTLILMAPTADDPLVIPSDGMLHFIRF